MMINQNSMEEYFNPSNPAAFGGVLPLAIKSKQNVKSVKDWLSAQDAYTLHKPIRRKYKRRKTITLGINDLWQMDLVDLSSLAKFNDRFTFLLTCIDNFSKKAQVIPLKNKKGSTVCEAFQTMITSEKPKLLQSDKETEFLNAEFQTLLKLNNIKHYTSQNDDIKASIVERFNRTLKTKMYRYFTYSGNYRYLDILPQLVEAYNNSYHRSIGMTPNEVDETNKCDVRDKLFPNLLVSNCSFKFDVGDRVRISETRRVFKKGYLPNWTIEIFTIKTRYPTSPPTYEIQDYNLEPVLGKFYETELQKVIKVDNVYKIDKVLKTKIVGGKK